MTSLISRSFARINTKHAIKTVTEIQIKTEEGMMAFLRKEGVTLDEQKEPSEKQKVDLESVERRQKKMIESI
jgi:hypothetical protein